MNALTVGIKIGKTSRKMNKSPFQAYMTDAVGIAETKSGGRFLIYEEDLNNEI